MTVTTKQITDTAMQRHMLAVGVQPTGVRGMRKVYNAVLSLSDEAGGCSATQEEIAARAHRSLRSVVRILARLKEIGLLERDAPKWRANEPKRGMTDE